MRDDFFYTVRQGKAKAETPLRARGWPKPYRLSAKSGDKSNTRAESFPSKVFVVRGWTLPTRAAVRV
jgi:hypothetical protein